MWGGLLYYSYMATGGVTPPQQPANVDLQTIEQRYRRDVTITEARPVIERVFFAAWAAVDVALLAFFMATVVWYFADGMWTDARRFAAAVVPMARQHALVKARAPSELATEDPMVFSAGDRVDLVSELSHSATGWMAKVTYRFVWSGGESAVMRGVVFADVPYFATALGVEDASARDARLVVYDVSWVAQDRRNVSDLAAWRDDRMQFDVLNAVVASDLGFEAGKPVTRVDFTLHNRSPFSYWDPTFVAVVYRGRSPAAVTTFVPERLQAGERRPISLRFFEALPTGSTVEVYPRIDFSDPRAYMNPNDAVGGDVLPDGKLPVVDND